MQRKCGNDKRGSVTGHPCSVKMGPVIFPPESIIAMLEHQPMLQKAENSMRMEFAARFTRHYEHLDANTAARFSEWVRVHGTRSEKDALRRKKTRI